MQVAIHLDAFINPSSCFRMLHNSFVFIRIEGDFCRQVQMVVGYFGNAFVLITAPVAVFVVVVIVIGVVGAVAVVIKTAAAVGYF